MEKNNKQSLKKSLNLPDVNNMQSWERWAKATGNWGPDYDYSKMGEVDERGHGSDLGKLPNHPTFSTQSAYSEDGNPGVWQVGRDGKDFFQPSQEQVSEFGGRFYDRYSQDTGDRIFIPQKEEPGLVDVSGLSTVPVSSAFAGLKGIQLAKGVDLARKVSYGKEMARNSADAKKFAAALALSAENGLSVSDNR